MKYKKVIAVVLTLILIYIVFFCLMTAIINRNTSMMTRLMMEVVYFTSVFYAYLGYKYVKKRSKVKLIERITGPVVAFLMGAAITYFSISPLQSPLWFICIDIFLKTEPEDGWLEFCLLGAFVSIFIGLCIYSFLCNRNKNKE